MKLKEIFTERTVHIVILALTAVLLYSIALHYEMYPYLDDDHYVINNEYLGLSFENIRHWLTQPCIGLFVPVTMFSFMFDYSIWGKEPSGYHLQNIFWFIITVIGIYSCFVKLKLKPRQAFLLVLIYTVHPQRVESVVWITERKDVICGAFFFAALFFYLDRPDRNRFNFLTFFLYIVALFAKPMAVTLPVILAMLDFSRKRCFSPWYYIKKFWPYGLVIIAYLAIIANVRRDFIYPPENTGNMILVILFNIYWYVKSAFICNFHEMCVLYPRIVFGWQTGIQMLVFYVTLAGIGIIAFLKVKKETLLYSVLPVAICYLAVLSPVLGTFRFSSPNYADRYNYIPSAVLLFAAGCIAPFAVNKRNRNIILSAITVYIAFLAFSTIKYLPCWKNNIAVFSKSCEYRPPNLVALISLGLVELKAENLAEAFAVSERLRKDYLNDSSEIPGKMHAMQLYIKAAVLFKSGAQDQAAKILSCLLKDKYLIGIICKLEAGETLYSMCANIYLRKRMVKGAVLCFKEIIKLEYVAASNVLFYKGMIAFFENRKHEALNYLEKAGQLAPDDKNINYNLKIIRDSLKNQAPAKKKP
ncbi:MAG: hypothetical protein PHV82_05485 [Victivallaceae bacterium]|nr:hypothetical protein [Victivallaceae bacterium]